MNLEDVNKKRVMHIDTSSKLYERKGTAIAFMMLKNNFHRGACLSFKLKKELERDLKINKDYAQAYAIFIYYLIKDYLDIFDILVICNDENVNKVKKYLQSMFQNDNKFSEKEIYSIRELRILTGDHKLRSYANNIANSYRRRGLKKLQRQQKGIPLNLLKINYRMIAEKWNKN